MGCVWDLVCYWWHGRIISLIGISTSKVIFNRLKEDLVCLNKVSFNCLDFIKFLKIPKIKCRYDLFSPGDLC